MLKPRTILAALILGGLLAATAAAAHPDLGERITHVTSQIAANPENPSLWIRRGRLFRDNREWERALADVDHALELDPGIEAAQLLRVAVLVQLDRPGEALAGADRYLDQHADDPEALVLHARALVALGQPRTAAADLDAAIRRMEHPAIDLLVERARTLAAGEGGDLDAALKSLDEAAGLVGPVISLRLEAVRLAHAAGRDDLALPRLDDLIEVTPSPARLLGMRGAMLCGAGRLDEGAASFERALGAILALAPAPGCARVRPRCERGSSAPSSPQKPGSSRRTRPSKP
ncbi:MAG: hypothetical protein IPJ41_03580 [Phycisphaerales bacterium]|nr:hypothetical protein [Phycisphaerales bacterium]